MARTLRNAATPPVTHGWPADSIEQWPIERLIPYARNSRMHSDEQIAQIAASMREWGWAMPCLVTENGTIIAGHARVRAARQLEYSTAPVMIARGWSEAKVRAYVIADNRLAENASWDTELLGSELLELQSEFDVQLTGFSEPEIEQFTLGQLPPLFNEKDGSIAGDVKMVKCPACGHEFPR
jgi:ParB-like chromosome segregation protein Spo0J